MMVLSFSSQPHTKQASMVETFLFMEGKTESLLSTTIPGENPVVIFISPGDGSAVISFEKGDYVLDEGNVYYKKIGDNLIGFRTNKFVRLVAAIMNPQFEFLHSSLFLIHQKSRIFNLNQHYPGFEILNKQIWDGQDHPEMQAQPIADFLAGFVCESAKTISGNLNITAGNIPGRRDIPEQFIDRNKMSFV
ncbi:MAG: hypothetical protein J0H55_08660 [Chitinophagaceae bacterium]|nr:hypothetical protein [Chitinophagaceae bacterium]